MREISCKRRWLSWKVFLTSLPVLNLATVAFAQTEPYPTIRRPGGLPLSARLSLWDLHTTSIGQ